MNPESEPVPHSQTQRLSEQSELLPDFAEIGQVTVRVTEGPDAGTVYDASAERFVIGTHPSADLRLTDPAVSRFHVEIAWRDERPLIRDLESTNGIVVNGTSIIEAYLDRGATIQVGRTQLVFDIADEALNVPVSRRASFGALVGYSVAMRRLFAVLERVSPSEATILIEGETGTGKELTAESIHRASPRRDAPFIVVDCGALPSGLLESELFGHVRGAFTGAIGSRRGAFRAAQGGTIFLDEIGELPEELQPKLLRVLERREVRPVGQSHHEPVDVRVVAATHRNLQKEVNARRFRADLYYRLAVLRVQLPPLRERLEDLPLLVGHILAALGAGAGRDAALTQHPGFIEELRRHSWPGNARELRNYLERCLALNECVPLETEASEASEASEAPEGSGPARTSSLDAGIATQPFKEAREAALRRFESSYLQTALAANQGNVRAAARAAGLDRVYFYRLLHRHGLK